MRNFQNTFEIRKQSFISAFYKLYMAPTKRTIITIMKTAVNKILMLILTLPSVKWKNLWKTFRNYMLGIKMFSIHLTLYYQKILKTSVMYCWGSTTPLCKVNKLIILGWKEALTLTIIIKVGTLENIPIENSVSF